MKTHKQRVIYIEYVHTIERMQSAFKECIDNMVAENLKHLESFPVKYTSNENTH